MDSSKRNLTRGVIIHFNYDFMTFLCARRKNLTLMEHVLFETGVLKAQLELGGMPAFAREPLLFELERELLRFCEQRSQLFAAGAYSTWAALLSNNAGSNLLAAFRSLFSDALASPFAPSDSRHQPPQQQQQCGVCQGNASPPPSPVPSEPSVRTLDELLLLSSRPLTVRRSLTLRNAGSLSVFVYGLAIDGHVCEHNAFRIVDCPLQTSSEPPLGNSTSSYLLKPNDTLVLELEFTPDFTLTHVDATLQLLVQLAISSPTELRLQPEKLFGERELLPLLEHLHSARTPPPSVSVFTSLSTWFYSLWSRVPPVSIVAARMSAAATASDARALQHLHLNRGDLQEFRLRALIPRLGAQHCMAAADRWPLENPLHKLCVPVLLVLALVALVLGVLDAKQLSGSHRASLLTLHRMLTSTNSAAAAALFTVPTRRAGYAQAAASYERERNLPVFDLKALLKVSNAGETLSDQQASGSSPDGASQSRMSRTRPLKCAPLTLGVGVGASRVGAPSRARNLVLETADAYAAIRHVGALTLLRVLLHGAIGSLLSALLAVPSTCARALTGLVVLIARRVLAALSTLLQVAALYARALCGLAVEWASLALRVSLDRLVTILLDWRTMVGQRDARPTSSALRNASTSRTSSKAATRQSAKANERPALESTSAAGTAAGTAIVTNCSASARMRSSSSARLSDSNSNCERRRPELADDASAPRTTARARPSKPASDADAFHLHANTVDAASASAQRVAEAQEGGSALINDEATSYVADAPRFASARRLQQRGFASSRESSWHMNSGRLKRKAARKNSSSSNNNNNNHPRLRANASNAESRQEILATLKAATTAAAGERRAPRASSSSADESISDGPESRAHAEERTPGHRAVDEDQPTSAITDSEGDEADVETRERLRKKTPLASPARRATRQPPRRQPAPSSSSRRAQLIHRRTNSKGNLHERYSRQQLQHMAASNTKCLHLVSCLCSSVAPFTRIYKDLLVQPQALTMCLICCQSNGFVTLMRESLSMDYLETFGQCLLHTRH